MRYLLIFFGSLLAAAAYAMPIRSSDGSVLGYVEDRDGGDKVVVLDCKYNQLGYSTKFGTWNMKGQRITMDQQPMLLLKDSPCQKPLSPR